MPTKTYTPLGNFTILTPATSVSISSISTGYRDLVLVVNGLSASVSPVIGLRFNADSAANYADVELKGDGTTNTSTVTSAATSITGGQITTTNQASMVFNIFDYTATDKHKTVTVRSAQPTLQSLMNFGRWASTAAITSISVFTSANMAAGTTFSLYGIVSQ